MAMREAGVIVEAWLAGPEARVVWMVVGRFGARVARLVVGD